MAHKLRVDIYEQLPVGSYRAKLTGRKEMPASAKFPDAGPSFAWEFTVTDGPHAGATASAWTPTRLSTQNNLGRLVQRMLGRPIRSGEEIDLDDFLDREYTIILDLTQDGARTKVISAQPIAGAVAPAASAPMPMPTVPVSPPPAPSPSRNGKVPASPAAPAPAKRFIEARTDVRQPDRWCHVAPGDGSQVEVTVAHLRARVESGEWPSQDVQVFVPEAGEWVPYNVIDLPF
ncbi:MAG: hypothetical protein EBR82_16895 [Caulobacteraceae bacterium]|nr:hypothetical protein [Caulobacteraceae bacterium]